MPKIFIYGVPGVGKTHFSNTLGNQLKIPVLEGDKIKLRTRKNMPKNKFPFLYLGTCQAYQQFGELNEENALNGLTSVRAALRKEVESEVRKYDDLILEAAFLDPAALKKYGEPVLLTLMDEKEHRKRFLGHREKLLDFQRNEFKAARIVQNYLISEAHRLNIMRIDTGPSPSAE